MENIIKELQKELTVLDDRRDTVRNELRRLYIQRKLDKLGVKCGQYVLVYRNKEKWRLGSMHEQEMNNLLGSDYVWLYGYKVKKDGTDSKRLTVIYNDNIESIKE